jgi:hypothetical protein
MKLSRLISLLEAAYEKHGDLDTFTNGEHGAWHTIPLSGDTISTGPAEVELDEEFFENCSYLEKGDIVLHIGGY